MVKNYFDLKIKNIKSKFYMQVLGASILAPKVGA
jgi:hypothetical protein